MRRLFFFLFFLICAQAIATEQIVFPAPPRLATTAQELATLRTSAESAPARDQTIKTASELLKEPALVPDGAGDWTFYYACPDDGVDLVALNLKEHQCPKCKKIYTDERIQAAYRTRLHDKANSAAEQLGWAFAYTDDEAYAAAAQKILLKLADDYPNYPNRHDRWGRSGLFAQLGGRRYAQSLDEAYAIIKLAKAYDLSRNAKCWSDEQRKHVEKDLFRNVADTLFYANLDINNHQTWFNAGLIAIASVLGDAEMVQKVLTMRGGYRDQLARSVDRDGLWYEGTMAYQNYALQAMIQIVDAGRRMGLPLHDEPKFRKLLMGPLSCAYPDGRFPAINDSDPMDIHSFDWSFKWAAEAYKDWPGKPTPPAETHSVDLSEAGLAVLRQGEGDRAVCAMIDYGPHGGGHGHFDKLNLMLFANGREWLLDPGRLSYSHKEYKTWVKHTAAHNTVSIGGKSQAATEGKLLWFDVKPDYSACAVRCDSAYPGAILTRYLLLTEDVLVDYFTVSTEKEMQIDWFAHAISERLEAVPPREEGAAISPGVDEGYQHLANARAWNVAGNSSWNFLSKKDLSLRLWLAGEKQEQLIATTGIGYQIDSKVPCLIRRVNGTRANFATVYDLGGKGEFVRGFVKAESTLRIETTNGRWAVAFSEKGVSWVAE